MPALGCTGTTGQTGGGSSYGCELPGRVEEWLVEEGAAVTAGQEVVRLNTADLQAALRQQEARRASTRKTVTVGEATLAVANVALKQAEEDAALPQLQLESAEASLQLAQREFERTRLLARDEIATAADLDRATHALTQATLAEAMAKDAIVRAQVAVQVAQVRVQQADAGLGLNRTQVDEIDRDIEATQVALLKMTIKAPFAGRFEEHLVEAGDVVAAGQSLGIVYDMSYLRVAVDVPDRYVPLLDTSSEMVQTYLDLAMPGAAQDLSASITVPGLPKLTGGAYAGVELPADIHRVAQAANPISNTFRVELRLANPGQALKQGMIVQTRIQFLRYDAALVVPVKAVQVSENGPRVLVVERTDGRDIARVRRVEPITITGDTMLIRGEIAGGENLIVSGGKGILDGEQVNVVIANGELVTQSDSPSPAASGGRPAPDGAEAVGRGE